MTQIEAKLETLFWQIHVCTAAFGHNVDVFLLEKTYLFMQPQVFENCTLHLSLNSSALTFASIKKCSIS